jgi:hypothetical protein
MPCRSAKDLDFVFPIWFTQCGCVFTHAIPFTCQQSLKATAQRGMERHGMCELAVAVLKRHVGDLPAFGKWQGRGRETV